MINHKVLVPIFKEVQRVFRVFVLFCCVLFSFLLAIRRQISGLQKKQSNGEIQMISHGTDTFSKESHKYENFA